MLGPARTDLGWFDHGSSGEARERARNGGAAKAVGRTETKKGTKKAGEAAEEAE